MDSGQIVFSYGSVDDAIRQLESLKGLAGQCKTINTSMAVSKGSGAKELCSLAKSVSSFAAGLEAQIASAITWLNAAKADFNTADNSSAAQISSLGGGGGSAW